MGKRFQLVNPIRKNRSKQTDVERRKGFSNVLKRIGENQKREILLLFEKRGQLICISFVTF